MGQGDDYKTKDDISKILSLIFGVLPPIFAQLEPMLTSVFGKAFRSQIGGPGGDPWGSAPLYPGHTFGSTSLMGHQNYGMNAFFGLNDVVGAATMRESQEVAEAAYVSSLKLMGGYFARDEHGKALEGPALEKVLSNPLSMSAFLHDLAYQQREPHMLSQGIRESQRYMGVGFTGGDSADHQIKLRAQASSIATRLEESWNDTDKRGDWGNVGGRDAGRIISELGRTGGINSNMSLDEVEDAAQQAARSVQAFRQIFRGTVPDVLRQMNALLGTDVVQTFKGAEEDLIRNMAATGIATGFTRHQMGGIVGKSAEFSQSMGLDPWGAAASGTFAAQFMGVHRQGGTGPFHNFGVNEPRFRGNMIRQVTGAAESGLARDISGAYAMIQARLGDDKAAEFIKAINNKTDIRSGAHVAAVANDFLGDEDHVTAFGIRDASFSAAGEVFRASGVGTPAAIQARAGLMNRSRVGMVAAELSAMGVAPGDIKNIRSGLQGQTVDVDNVLEEIGGVWGEDDPRRLQLRGKLRNRFAQQAAFYKMGNAFESDKMLSAFGNPEQLEYIQGSAASNVLLQDLLKNRGPGGALANLNDYIQKVGDDDDPGFTGAKEFYTAVTGNANPTVGEIAAWTKTSAGLLAAVKKSTTKEDDVGLGIILQGLFNQTVNGRNITGEEYEHFRQITQKDGPMSEADRLEAMRKVAHDKYDFDASNLESGPLGVIVRILTAIKDAVEGATGK